MATSLTRRAFHAASLGLAFAPALQPGRALGQEPKVLRIRFNRDISVVDPAYMQGGYDKVMGFSCLGRLVNYKSQDTWEWAPSAFIESIEQVDDLHIAFTLKPGIKWTNGFGELTAEDVKYSYERAKVVPNWEGKWTALDHVEVVDTYRGVLVLNTPFAPFWLLTLVHGVSSIVSKAATEAAGGKFTTEFPAQCGPYLFSNWQPQQQITLTKNSDWSGTPPGFDEVRGIIIEDPKSAELAIEAGEIDLTQVSLNSMLRYSKDLPAGLKLLTRKGLSSLWLGMNVEHPKLQDVRVRQAIRDAIDIEAILEAAYGGLAMRAHGVVGPGVIGHREQSAVPPRPELEKARALLAEAGVSGLKLELKTLNQQDRVIAAQLVQADLAQIGIEVAVTPEEPGVFWSLGQESEGDYWKDLQIWLMQYTHGPDPHDIFFWFVRNQVGVWNWERWSDDEFETLFQQGVRETDPAKRETMYLRMQEIMDEKAAYVWIAHEPTGYLYRDTIVPAVHPDGVVFPPEFEPA